MSVSPSFASLIGRRFSIAGTVYLAEDQGVRGITDPATYTSLFRDWSGIEALDGSSVNLQDLQAFNQAPKGPPIGDGTELAKDPNAPAVYLIDQGWKRWIANPAVMDQYYFSWQAIQSMSASALAALPTGDPITGTVSLFLVDQVQALTSNVDLWNHWRADYPGAPINLSTANLSGADLRWANLSAVNLIESQLSSLSGADLSGANLSGVHLDENTDLSGANLSGAILSEPMPNLRWEMSGLSGANLSGAILRGVNLTNANLSYANLTGAIVTGTVV